MTTRHRRIAEGDDAVASQWLEELAACAGVGGHIAQESSWEGGVHLFAAAAGENLSATDRITYRDPIFGSYTQLRIARRPDGAEHLVAALLVGDCRDGAWYARLIAEQTPVNALRKTLVFGDEIGARAGQESIECLSIKEAARPGANMREKLVVIGNGMAGMRTVEELLELAPDLYDITVFGAEPYGNYNRILLSPVLAGEKTVGEIMLNDDAWYAEHGITLHKGKEVVRIDRGRRRVIGADGTEAPYDRLLIATGSTPFLLPVPGVDLDGVIKAVRPGGGDRWRLVGPRSGPRASQERHARDRHPSHGHADGAPARRRGRCHAAPVARAARPHRPDRGQDQGDHRRKRPREGGRA
jgi:hypothetical protein